MHIYIFIIYKARSISNIMINMQRNTKKQATSIYCTIILSRQERVEMYTELYMYGPVSE